jgi:hypothetical protein
MKKKVLIKEQETMLEYRQYYLRELRMEMAKIIQSFLSPYELYQIPLGRYIMGEMEKEEEENTMGFRVRFKGVMPVFTDYNLVFTMWSLLYRVKYFHLYYDHHTLVGRILDEVSEEVDIQEVNQLVKMLFTIHMYSHYVSEKTDLLRQIPAEEYSM